MWGGGGFGTRLNLNLREDKGYSYGVFSTLVLMREAGIWYAAGPVQTDKTKESVVEFDKELKALAGAKPISADEFATAKQVKVRGYAQQFESFTRVGGQIEPVVARAADDRAAARVRRDGQGDAAATLAAAKKYARPERASIVLVGDRAKIEAKVRDLKVGEIVVVDAEGRPVSGAGAGSSSVR